jgi:HEAT repeat protein
MSFRTLGTLLFAVTLSTSAASGQASPANAKGEPVADGRTLSEWIADLKAPAPVNRNAAAYEIAGMGPAAAPAVPALIAALDDEIAAVRFPVTVALGEIGPGAEAAIPRLKQVMEDDINDEVAASAKRAIRRIRPEAVPTE